MGVDTPKTEPIALPVLYPSRVKTKSFRGRPVLVAQANAPDGRFLDSSRNAADNSPSARIYSLGFRVVAVAQP